MSLAGRSAGSAAPPVVEGRTGTAPRRGEARADHVDDGGHDLRDRSVADLAGRDRMTSRVCDTSGSCATATVTIVVAP